MRAFAVQPEALPREAATNKPGSANWSLYEPAKLAEMLGLPVERVDEALEQTGFLKAVRIREELISWKERLRREEREIAARVKVLNEERRALGARHAALREQLQNVRNLLRLPRGRTDKEP